MTTSQAAPPSLDGLWGEIRDQAPGGFERLQLVARELCAPLLRGKGVPAGDLDELLQDVCVSVWSFSRKHAEPPRNLREFLKWRARGVFSKYLRELLRKDRLGEVNLPVISEDDGARPWDDLLVEELRAALDGCLAELPEQHRRVWDSRYERDLSPLQTAQHLGVPASTVNVHLHRARHRLMECLRRKKVLS